MVLSVALSSKGAIGIRYLEYRTSGVIEGSHHRGLDVVAEMLCTWSSEPLQILFAFAGLYFMIGELVKAQPR